MNDIQSLVSPKSVALIGASDKPEKIGFQILKNIIDGGYAGEIFPVNLTLSKILGKKVYPNISDIGSTIDLAIIAIPAPYVKPVVLECAKKNVRSIIIISAGFAEISEDGKLLQEEIAKICQENRISLLGPNCLGLINTDSKLNASFANDMPSAGSVSLISQSGAIISSLIDWSKNASIGFNKIFSIGNKALMKESDLLKYLYLDEKTKVIACYIEKLDIDEELTKILIEYAKKKPTVVLFGGKSSFGAKAALSHTGSVVTSYLSVKTYLTQAGVIMAESLEDLLLYARVFSDYRFIGGDRVAIITNAGGPGIAAADKISSLNLSMAHFSPETDEQLKDNLRKEANTKNPVDVLGDADELAYQKAIDIVSADPNTDGILLILTPQSSTKIKETAEIIAGYQGKKPLISSFVGGEILSHAKEVIEASGKPCFSYPEEAALALRILADYSTVPQTLVVPVNSKHATLDLKNREKELLDFDLPILQYFESDNIDTITSEADKIGYPVVLKIADQTAHKSDVGGIFLNLQNSSELERAFRQIDGPVIIGKMISTKFELMLGIKKEENIGTTVLFGTGGIYSEIYNDFSYRIAPISHEVAKEMILETKIGRILDGARNQHKYDLDKLADIICNSVRFAQNFRNISELDFNPIIADADDFYMVDVRVITK